MADPVTSQPSYADLVRQNQVLQQNLTALKAEEKAIWTMLAGANRRIQMSSSAIKAAVSSLLSYDIMWDGANQHEFLDTINTSVDQAGNLIKLLTLTFRLEAESLSIKCEPQVLQEIVSAVQDYLTTSLPNLALGVTLPPEGKLVEVDYEYFMLALELLLEAIQQMGVQRLDIQAVEESDHWALQIEGIDSPTLQIIWAAFEQPVDSAMVAEKLSPDNLLRLRTASQIFKLQEISLSIPDSSYRTPQMNLIIRSIK